MTTQVRIRILDQVSGRSGVYDMPGGKLARSFLERDGVEAVTLVGSELEIRLRDGALLLQEENTPSGTSAYRVLTRDVTWSATKAAADLVRLIHPRHSPPTN